MLFSNLLMSDNVYTTSEVSAFILHVDKTKACRIVDYVH